jgi:hypothetical protein
VCVCNEAICDKVFPIVFDIIVILVNFGLFLEELIETPSPSFTRS